MSKPSKAAIKLGELIQGHFECSNEEEKNFILDIDAAMAEERVAAEEIRSAYADYVSLLTEELHSVSSLASVHGWVLGRYEQGLLCRGRIERARASYESARRGGGECCHQLTTIQTPHAGKQ